MLATFGPFFTYATFAAVLLMAIIFASPLGNVRLGGVDAQPLLKRWNLFAITLCTTIATGILFWGAAEPMFHLADPPVFANVAGDERATARFALSTVYLHWSVTPYAIYAVPALAFALAFHNFGGKYSISAPFKLLFGEAFSKRSGNFIDALALFALVAGVAASLGAGVMTLAGGLESIMGVDDTIWGRLIITASIVFVYVLSSISGLKRGIKVLSDINIRFFFLLCAFVFVAADTVEILKISVESIGVYFRDFIPRSLGWGGLNNDPWTLNWTVFFFANWLAWAPITALFLGRIAVGYTVREFIGFNLILPALFGVVWMSIFGGSAILAEWETDGALTGVLESNGPESVIYTLLETLPFAAIVSFLFIIVTFISFVTAMDSNTHSIAGVSLRSGSFDDREQMALFVKIFWGVLIGAVSWVMTSTNGIDGIRILVNLGGAPGLFILVGSGAVLVKLLISHVKG